MLGKIDKTLCSVSLTMLLYFLIYCSISAVGSTCTDGYEDMGNGLCYKHFTTQKSQREAEAFCEGEEGHLVQPLNAFVNAYILTEAENIGAWLGLTCTGLMKTSCTYSNGDFVTSSSYANFYPGNPEPSEGNCVFLSTSGSESGHWISGKCETKQGFGCQRNSSENGFPPNNVPTCGTSYHPNGDFCYKLLAPSNEENAESVCELECGHLTTIHSQNENYFVRDLASTSGRKYARIGLLYTEDLHYEWIDGTRMNPADDGYFGYDEPALGNCVAISLVDDFVKSGQWINTPCSSNMTSVCKRPKTKPCVPPVVAPSLIPSTCTSPSLFEENGTIYSPGYPSNYYNGLECEYLITAPQGYVVFFLLKATEFSDSASSISLYNSITDTFPFLPRLRFGFDAHHTFYASTTSTMRVKFLSGSSNKYKWSADYLPVDIRPSGCNQGVIHTPGTITSPNFKNQALYGLYPSHYNCTYELETEPNYRVLLSFGFYIAYNSNDYVAVYDGSDSNSPLLAKYTPSDFPSGKRITATSTSNRMFVIFITDDMFSAPGFSAIFKMV